MNSMGIFIVAYLLTILMVVFMLISIYGWILIIRVLNAIKDKAGTIYKDDNGNLYIKIGRD